MFGPFDDERRADPLRRAAAGRRRPQRPPRPRRLRDPLRPTAPSTRSRPRPSRSSPRTARRARSPSSGRAAPRTGPGAEMKVKLWGTRGSIPSPGPETIRYGGNTSCVGVTLSDGSLLALDAGTGIRSLGLALAAEPARLHILLTHLHLDHIQGLVFFAPAFRPQTEIVIWGPASPEASLRDRIARYISAPLSPVEVTRAALRRLLPPLPGDRVGDRPGADPRRLGHPPRPDPRLPDRRRRPLAGLHPRPRARARRRPRHARGGLDLRLLAGARRLDADPRRPVRRLRVPRPRRLGPLRPLPRPLLRRPHRRRAHGPLPPRSRCTPTNASTCSRRKLGTGGSSGRRPERDRARGRGRRVRPRLAGRSLRGGSRRGRRAYSLSLAALRESAARTRAARTSSPRRSPSTTVDQGAEEDVGDQHDRAGHRQRQERQADDREPVGEMNQLLLALQPKVIR